ncbi:MAG: hypothetical protein ISR64_09300 [Deltaproteobacteria bacterium]|nr:hypothetical protein [Deltaproteobacteria bacterium]
MKAGRIVLALAVLVLALTALGGCSGGSRPVSSCSECNDNANWQAKEYCVTGPSSQLYCANPCYNPIHCTADHRCVPLLDQGTTWDNRQMTRWVCMPGTYYTGLKEVRRMGGDCGQANYACGAAETCLWDDDVADPSGVAYYCADACASNPECLTGCCTQAVGGDYYCSPEVYCL